MTVVAYAFAVPCVVPVGASVYECPKRDVYFQIFRSSLDCRSALSHADASLQVVVCNESSDVAPLNLVAALHSDEPQRDIYVITEDFSAAYAHKVRAAGARGIINREQMEAMIGFSYSESFHTAKHTSLIATLPADASTPDCSPKQSACAPPVLSAGSDALDCLSTVAMQAATPRTHSTGASLVDSPSSTHITLAAPMVNMVDQLHLSDPSKNKKGCVAAFVSGRGGVGRSTLSLLSALLLTMRGLRVVLVDLDLQFGDLAYCVDRMPKSAIQRLSFDAALNGPEQPQPSPERLCLIEAPARPEQAEEYTAEIIDLLHSCEAIADFVIVNTSSFWSELQAILAQSADHLVFLMDQRSTSIKGCKQAVDLCIRLQIPSARFLFLLNRCSRGAPLTTLDASMALGGVEVMSIEDGGSLVDEMLSLGCPHELLKSNAAFLGSFEPLLTALNAALPPITSRTNSTVTTFTNLIKARKRGGL